MRSIWKVWFSKRRKIYFRIARKFHTTPWKVYRLGHGGMSKNKKDIKIGRVTTIWSNLLYLPLVILSHKNEKI